MHPPATVRIQPASDAPTLHPPCKPMHAGVPRTKLFINLTAGLELLRYVPAAQQAVIERL